MLPLSTLGPAARRLRHLAPVALLLLSAGAWPVPATAAGQSACVRRAPIGERASLLLVRAEPPRLLCGHAASGGFGGRLEAVAQSTTVNGDQLAGDTPIQDSAQAMPVSPTAQPPMPDDGSTDVTSGVASTVQAAAPDAGSIAAPVGQATSVNVPDDGAAADAAPATSSSGVMAAAVASTAPWVRSIVCPVLYTHEVPSQAGLRAILLALIAAGYQPTSLRNVDQIMSGAAPPLPGCLVLTFDDALYSQYLNALPVLLSLQTPAVFFVMPAFADGVHRYMAASQIAAVAQAGFEVEAHTCNHPSLPALARRNYDAFLAEIVDCRRMIENITGAPVPFLAYPDGSYDATVLAAVASAGYRGAFTTRASSVLNAGSPFTLPRIEYNPSEVPARVIARLHAAGA
ncbi:MAG: polysaccharide deacetylase family protein [Chloroflexi bacterium]|nr:polysaccharide deacetylase family protein [Chloroflexota bacterium]